MRTVSRDGQSPTRKSPNAKPGRCQHRLGKSLLVTSVDNSILELSHYPCWLEARSHWRCTCAFLINWLVRGVVGDLPVVTCTGRLRPAKSKRVGHRKHYRRQDTSRGRQTPQDLHGYLVINTIIPVAIARERRNTVLQHVHVPASTHIMFNRPLDSWTPRKGDSDLLPLAITVHRATPPTAVGLLVKNNAVWHIAGKDHRIEVLP